MEQVNNMEPIISLEIQIMKIITEIIQHLVVQEVEINMVTILKYLMVQEGLIMVFILKY